MRPSVIIVSEERYDLLLDEFGCYARDYELPTSTSANEAKLAARRLVADGGQVAMFVTESRLPDAEVIEAFHWWRSSGEGASVVPHIRAWLTST